ncbi:MAG: sulfatase-like hydrolase/transferase [Casimicrobiaceae bacterium]|nr:sulfatase-like hydrolase/transferase [Casimicrobiaceae bacterium]MDW8311825.1 sulfatase-like hydrolase/transferase [Burkholderiales bacterium]
MVRRLRLLRLMFPLKFSPGSSDQRLHNTVATFRAVARAAVPMLLAPFGGALLLLYVIEQPPLSVWAHLQISLALCACLVAPLVLAPLLPCRPRALRIWTAYVLGALWLIILCTWVLFYVLAAAAHHFWGALPTWQLIRSYLNEPWVTLRSILAAGWDAQLALILSVVLMTGILSWVMPRIMRTIGQILSGQNHPISPALLVGVALVFGAVGARGLATPLWPSVADDPDEAFTFFLETHARPVSGVVALLPRLERLGNPLRVIEESNLRAGYRAAPLTQRPNVILIIADSLRPDHLPIYGYPRATTPFLQTLQATGKLHAHAEVRAACAESSCGILSILSGKQPHELTRANFGLPEILARHGYRRLFLLSGDHTNFYGLRHALGEAELYSDGYTRGGYPNDDETLVRFVEQLPPAASGEAYFVLIHLMSTHRFGPRAVKLNRAADEVPPALWQRYPIETAALHFYDDGIRTADAVIERLWSALSRLGYLRDDSLVLLTADHGEALGQHGVRAHGYTLYEPLLRIPFVWLNGAPAGLRDRPAIQADIAPTIARALGLPIPSHWSGHPLQDSPPPDRISVHVQPPHVAILQCDARRCLKLIRDFSTMKEALFDLRADPEERQPLALEHPQAAALRAHFSSLRLDDLVPSSGPPGAEAIAKAHRR